jgi:hypothetical protein
MPYLLDVMCIANPFAGMGWNWFNECTHVHLYCKDLWSIKYMPLIIERYATIA